MAFLFRPQRFLLAEAMAEVQEFADRAALDAYLLRRGYDEVQVAAYGGIDKRIGWDTYIVTAHPLKAESDNRWVCGFTNGPS